MNVLKSWECKPCCLSQRTINFPFSIFTSPILQNLNMMGPCWQQPVRFLRCSKRRAILTTSLGIRGSNSTIAALQLRCVCVFFRENLRNDTGRTYRLTLENDIKVWKFCRFRYSTDPILQTSEHRPIEHYLPIGQCICQYAHYHIVH